MVKQQHNKTENFKRLNCNLFVSVAVVPVKDVAVSTTLFVCASLLYMLQSLVNQLVEFHFSKH